MEETSFPYQSPQKNNKILPTVIVVGVLLVGVVVSFLIIKQPKKTEEKKEVAAVKNEPTPTTKPKIEKSSVKIQVINGTGTPGQAGTVVKALEEAGYSADNIKTGNAEEFINSTTTIEGRINFEEITKDIENVLKPTFSEIKVKSTNLDKDSEFDIVVVTGGKIFATATPTKSISPTGSPTPTTTVQPTSTPTSTPSPTPTP